EVIDGGERAGVITGGGAAGVELAGGLMELFTSVLTKDFPNLDLRRARVVLVELSDRLLGTFAPRLPTRAYRTLTKRGVEVMLGVGVHKVDAGALYLRNGTRIPTRALLGTAGVEATPPARALGPPSGPGGGLRVHP